MFVLYAYVHENLLIHIEAHSALSFVRKEVNLKSFLELHDWKFNHSQQQILQKNSPLYLNHLGYMHSL